MGRLVLLLAVSDTRSAGPLISPGMCPLPVIGSTLVIERVTSLSGCAACGKRTCCGLAEFILPFGSGDREAAPPGLEEDDGLGESVGPGLALSPGDGLDDPGEEEGSVELSDRVASHTAT